jgi:hypothetical protein
MAPRLSKASIQPRNIRQSALPASSSTLSIAGVTFLNSVKAGG